jgi:proteasome lid subunit RPN8/RPN11
MQADTLRAIQAHAGEAYPKESCGLIVATAAGEQYLRCTNKAATASEHFVIAAEDYAAAEDQGELLAVVHSHPDAPATPSDGDRVLCEASGLPWHILSVGQVDGQPEFGALLTITPEGYRAPLVGRQFQHGVLDCYTLVRDFYALELGVQLGDYQRQDDWWLHGGDLYADNFAKEGFSVVTDEPRRGDLFLMQIRSPSMNHAGIYLGDGQMLHHLQGRLSERVPYGGYWAERTQLIIRHKELA